MFIYIIKTIQPFFQSFIQKVFIVHYVIYIMQGDGYVSKTHTQSLPSWSFCSVRGVKQWKSVHIHTYLLWLEPWEKKCLVVKNYGEGPLDLEGKGNAVSGETTFKPGDEGLENNQEKIWRR